MKIKMSNLRRTIRRVLKESVHSHLDGELTNVVFSAVQVADEKYADITVEDVLEAMALMSDTDISSMVVEPDSTDPEDIEMGKYFVDAARNMSYEDVRMKMMELVSMGELQDDLEDFFSMPDNNMSSFSVPSR